MSFHVNVIDFDIQHANNTSKLTNLQIFKPHKDLSWALSPLKRAIRPLKGDLGYP